MKGGTNAPVHAYIRWTLPMKTVVNRRCPMTQLTATEVVALRRAVRDLGAERAAACFGVAVATLRKAALEEPIARLTAEAIRGRLDRI